MIEAEGRRIRECVETGRFEEALSVHPAATRRQVHRAHIRLLSRYRRHAEIRELLNAAKSRLTRESQIERGRRLCRIGHKDEALSCLLGAVGDEGEVDDHLLVGQSLAHGWKFDKALPYFEHVVARRGEASDRIWLGMALHQLGRIDEALIEFQHVVSSRGSAEDYHTVGELKLRCGAWEEAEPYLERAVALGGDSSSVLLLRQCRRARRRARVAALWRRSRAELAGLGPRQLIWLALAAAVIGGFLAVVIC